MTIKAFADGETAYYENIPDTANPYTPGTTEYYDWDCGWWAASYDSHDDEDFNEEDEE